MQVIDVSNPENPEKICTVNSPDSIQGVGASGSIAYLATSTAGIQIVIHQMQKI
ncbi:MAG: hypothetical protein HC887_06935 [Desulfobacteraceae bacterium]|nr:hypothetical protein [Desulfobacteraceae bacterium]